MKDGGWVSHDWQPQVITKFGEYSVKDLLAPPKDADMLRAGGHLKSYTPPSERAMQTYAMGGGLMVEDRGDVEFMGYNPEIAKTGASGYIGISRGPSHDKGGFNIDYNGSKVEVEGGETMLEKGGSVGQDNAMHVLGNMKLEKLGEGMMQGEAKSGTLDKLVKGEKLANMTFKSIGNKVAKEVKRLNKLENKAIDLANSVDGYTSLDKIQLDTANAKLTGAKMGYKDTKNITDNLVALQDAYHETAKEFGYDDETPDFLKNLKKGKLGEAKMGKKVSKAQGGINLSPQFQSSVSNLDDFLTEIGKTMDYEYTKGSAEGKGLKNYGNPALGQNPTKKKAMEWYLKNIGPKVGEFASGKEKGAAGDFMYNSGRDPRIYMLDQYLKSIGQPGGLPDRGSFNIDMNENPEQWAKKKPELDALWNAYQSDIQSLPQSQRLELLNKGRDFYYKNINKTKEGKPSSAYFKTWRDRVGAVGGEEDEQVASSVQQVMQAPIQQQSPVPYTPIQMPYSQGQMSPFEATMFSGAAAPSPTTTPTVIAAPSAKPTPRPQAPVEVYQTSSAPIPMQPSFPAVTTSTPFTGIPMVNQPASYETRWDDYLTKAPEAVVPYQIGKEPFGGYDVLKTVKIPSSMKGMVERAVKQAKESAPSKGATKASDNMGDYAKMIYNEILPYVRPINQLPLSPEQLMGEQFALATNVLEPVQAQTYQPMLETRAPQMTAQAMLNENQASFNALARQIGNNPAALSVLAAQKQKADSQAIAQVEAMNQQQRAATAARNISTLNDATLKNLSAMDLQFQRQAGARAATKAQAQTALSSIASKIAQNKLENLTSGVMQNMYNYRFGPKGRIVNYNPMADFTIPNVANLSDETKKAIAEQAPELAKQLGLSKSSKKEARNGSIVKAIKNL
jgi:hypothetical protein